MSDSLLSRQLEKAEKEAHENVFENNLILLKELMNDLSPKNKNNRNNLKINDENLDYLDKLIETLIPIQYQNNKFDIAAEFIEKYS